MSLTPCNSHPPGPSETPQTSGLLGSGGACLALLCGSPAAVVSRGAAVGWEWAPGDRSAPSCSCAARPWAGPGLLPLAAHSRRPPERVTQERKSVPQNGAAFPVTEHRHSCPAPWAHSPARDGRGTGPHGAGGRGSWEPPHHSSEHRDSCRITNKPQKTPDKRHSQ